MLGENFGKGLSQDRGTGPVVFRRRRKTNLIDQWEKEMVRLAREEHFEEAAGLRDRVETLRHMNEQITFREMSEEMREERVQSSRKVQALMTDLGLKKSPEIIECFDISHFQGDEKVASMVRFKNGRPDKSEYRKFIIRTVDGIDDFQSMGPKWSADVTGVCVAEEKPLPDLVPDRRRKRPAKRGAQGVGGDPASPV